MKSRKALQDALYRALAKARARSGRRGYYQGPPGYHSYQQQPPSFPRGYSPQHPSPYQPGQHYPQQQQQQHHHHHYQQQQEYWNALDPQQQQQLLHHHHQQHQQQQHQQQQQQFHHQQKQQQQQQHQPQQQQQQQDHGSWTNPVVIHMDRGDQLVMSDVLKILFLVWILSHYVSISFEDGTGGDEKKEGDGRSSESSSESSSSFSSSSSSSNSSSSFTDSTESISSGVSSLFGGYMNKDKVKPVDLNQVSHDVHWDDVLGCDEAKAELLEVTQFLKNPEKFTRLGGKLPKGYLLVGPPGTGKTMLAKAIAKEANVPFFYASGAQFEEVFVGVGSRRVRELFEAARARKPCLIFIDEIDAVGSKRSKLDASHDRATINQLLSEMDGFNSSDSIVVIAATNSPKTLDKALTRPGRLDRTVSVDPPDLRGRTQILEHYLKKVKAGHFSASSIARGTSGMTGADLANVVNLATINAAKNGLEQVTIECLEEAKDRVSMGLEHRSRKVPEHERVNTAYHEAGHALVAMFAKKAAPLHKATIIPRGQSLGLTVQLPPDDQISMSLSEMKDRLKVLMGGRIAEQVVFGTDEVTSGASNDLEQATNLARVMVRKYGLSSSLGCVDYSFSDDPHGIFLSNATRQKIEQEVKTLIDQAHAEAQQCITDKRDVLNAIAEGLLKNDTLTGTEMRKMAGLPEPTEGLQ